MRHNHTFSNEPFGFLRPWPSSMLNLAADVCVGLHVPNGEVWITDGPRVLAKLVNVRFENTDAEASRREDATWQTKT